jgi:hypothetical protein
MKAIAMAAIFLLWLLAPGGQAAAANQLETVLSWAPVIYEQDGTANVPAQENVFTVFNYDQDWRSNNNRQNLAFYPPERAMYYSLVESETHYYIGYYLYYPRDGNYKDREHYLSGVLVVVRKQADGTGRLDGLVTYNRREWRWVDGSKAGKDNGRLVLTVSTDSHDLRVIGRDRPLPALGRFAPLPPGREEQVVAHRVNGTWIQDGYRLVPLDELWQRRNDIGPGHTYGRWGYFDTNTYFPGAAALPWIWEYKNANWLANPAALVSQLRGAVTGPVQYVNNPYLEIVTAL